MNKRGAYIDSIAPSYNTIYVPGAILSMVHTTATKVVVRIAVILNDWKVNELITNDRALKMYSYAMHV